MSSLNFCQYTVIPYSSHFCSCWSEILLFFKVFSLSEFFGSFVFSSEISFCNFLIFHLLSSSLCLILFSLEEGLLGLEVTDFFSMLVLKEDYVYLSLFSMRCSFYYRFFCFLNSILRRNLSPWVVATAFPPFLFKILKK